MHKTLGRMDINTRKFFEWMLKKERYNVAPESASKTNKLARCHYHKSSSKRLAALEIKPLFYDVCKDIRFIFQCTKYTFLVLKINCTTHFLLDGLFAWQPSQPHYLLNDEKEAELSLPLGEVRNRSFPPFLPSSLRDLENKKEQRPSWMPADFLAKLCCVPPTNPIYETPIYLYHCTSNISQCLKHTKPNRGFPLLWYRPLLRLLRPTI